MKLRTVVFCLLISIPVISQAQLELGARFGIANYMGDLSGKKIVPSESGLAVGLLMRANLSSKWKFRTGLTYGRISGEDRDELPEDKSNLNFRTSILELSLEFEYDFLPFLPGSPTFTFAPYIFGGVAGFRYNPQAITENNTYINLRDLGTEGQNIPGSGLTPYSEFGLAIPFGIGFKKTISDQLIFGIEVGFRPTFTDYLDDVSSYYPNMNLLAQTENGETAVLLSDRRPEVDLEPAETGSLRGNPNNNDMYGFLLITLTKKLGAAPCYAF